MVTLAGQPSSRTAAFDTLRYSSGCHGDSYVVVGAGFYSRRRLG